MTYYPAVERLEDDVQHHGEAHVVVEEHDSLEVLADEQTEGTVEVRQGTADFDYEAGLITVDADSHPTVRVGMDRVVWWYVPESPVH